VGADRHVVPGRLERPDLGRRAAGVDLGDPADGVAVPQDLRVGLHLLLDPGHAAPVPVRPADAARLEAADPGSGAVADPLYRRDRLPPVRSTVELIWDC